MEEPSKKHNREELKILQHLPLKQKISMTERRIMDWYNHFNGNVYICFSGGKDSTVLLDIARKIYPDIEAVFVDTGLEYPEIKQFVKTFDNVTIVRPKMQFNQVIKKFGYPMISKEVSGIIHEVRRSLELGKTDTSRMRRLYGTHKDKSGNKSIFCCEKWKPILDLDFKISDRCCHFMKKQPSTIYEKQSCKKRIIGTLAEESRLRTIQWEKKGCNAYEDKHPHSNPMSFWTNQDVLKYIYTHNLQIAPVYGSITYKENPEQIRMDVICESDALATTGCSRTGCVFCGFGCHLEKGMNRFQRLKETHQKLYNYCLEGGEYGDDGYWIPTKNGLGMKHIFDELNRIYGKGFIDYD